MVLIHVCIVLICACFVLIYVCTVSPLPPPPAPLSSFPLSFPRQVCKGKVLSFLYFELAPSYTLEQYIRRGPHTYVKLLGVARAGCVIQAGQWAIELVSTIDCKETQRRRRRSADPPNIHSVRDS